MPPPLQDRDSGSHSTCAPVWILGASLDLKDAYLHVPMNKSARRWLRFHLNGTAYKFLWPLSGIKNVHLGGENYCRVPEVPGSQDLRLLRQLAHGSSLSSTPSACSEGCPHSVRTGITIGLHREPEEVQLETLTMNYVSGYIARLRTGTGFPLRMP